MNISGIIISYFVESKGGEPIENVKNLVGVSQLLKQATQAEMVFSMMERLEMAGGDADTLEQMQPCCEQAVMLVCGLLPEYVIPVQISEVEANLGMSEIEPVEPYSGEPRLGGKLWGTC